MSDEEVKRVVRFLTSRSTAVYDESITAARSGVSESAFDEGEEVDDALFHESRRVVTEAGRASTSLLQRRLRIGYARAARIMDLLEEKGIIGPPDGARPRDVLVRNTDDAGSVSSPVHAGEHERPNMSSTPPYAGDDADTAPPRLSSPRRFPPPDVE